MTTESEVRAALLSRLEHFNGREWSTELQEEVRDEVIAFFNELGLYPKTLAIWPNPDGTLGISCNNYVRKTKEVH